MKTAVKISVAALALCGVLMNPALSQTSETVLALQSKLASEALGGASTFNISFGSLNQGLLALANKPTSADGAGAFAAWYSANSRTFVSWNGVVGSAITDSDSFIRYYGPDTSVDNRAGDALPSIFNPAQDNRALAFVSYELLQAVESPRSVCLILGSVGEMLRILSSSRSGSTISST